MARLGWALLACVSIHIHVYIGDYIECLVVGWRWVPRKRKREGMKKREEGRVA